MSEDEREIRCMIATWMAASQAGDADTVLSLMTDDVVFLTPGNPPLGKAEFAEAARGLADMSMTGSTEIRELTMLGDWAHLTCFIRVTIARPGKPPVTRSGHTLTIVRKEAGGRWRLARDANMLTREA